MSRMICQYHQQTSLIDSKIIQNHFFLCFYRLLTCSTFLKPVIPQLNLFSLLVDLPNAIVNISNILAHLIPHFTQNLIQFPWSIFSNSNKSKNTPKHDVPFYVSKTNWEPKMADIVNIHNRYINTTEKNAKIEHTHVTHKIWK